MAPCSILSTLLSVSNLLLHIAEWISDVAKNIVVMKYIVHGSKNKN